MTRFVALLCLCITTYIPASSVLHAEESSSIVSSSYFGRFGYDEATDVVVGADGFVYVSGWTESFAFPSTGFDAFVLKLTPDSSQVVYTTYLRGSAFDIATGLTVDASGAVYVIGHTTSNDFPLVRPFQRSLRGESDVWIAKLDQAGTVVFSSYFGGSAFENGAAIALGSQGAVYATGSTGSTDLPGVTGIQTAFAGGSSDAFVLKLAGDALFPVFASYLGGNGQDAASQIVVGGDERAYVSGYTSSTNFPVSQAVQPQFGGGSSDAFVARVSPDGGSLTFSTYVGGFDFDAATGLAIDANGFVYLAGNTASWNFPTRSPIQPYHGGGYGDVFVTKLRPGAAELEFSTFLGGYGHDSTSGLSLDRRGHIHVVGGTDSLDFPLFPPTEEWMPDHDAFIAELSADGRSLVRSMPLGGTQFDTGAAIALSADEEMWVVGRSDSMDFPVGNAFQPWNQGSSDVFITRIVSTAPPNQAPIADAGPDQFVAADGCTEPVVLRGGLSTDADGDPLTFTWSGDFGAIHGDHAMVELPPGVHTITLTVDDGRGGQTSDTVTVTVLDAMAPWISSVSATPDVLSPPNHQMVPVTLSVDLTGSCEVRTACRIVAVSSSEPVDRVGNNNTETDWEVSAPLGVLIRAERNGNGDGRVYTVTVECADNAGNSTRKAVNIFVPRT